MVFSGSGRHRRPTQADRAVVAAGVAGAGLALPLLTATGAHAATVSTWDSVAQCASGGDWSKNAGDGRYGGLQLTERSWVAHGGDQYAAQPDHATKDQQIAVAEKVLADQGPTAWVTCGITAGLTGPATPNPTPPGSGADRGPDRGADQGVGTAAPASPTTVPPAAASPLPPVTLTPPPPAPDTWPVRVASPTPTLTPTPTTPTAAAPAAPAPASPTPASPALAGGAPTVAAPTSPPATAPAAPAPPASAVPAPAPTATSTPAQNPAPAPNAAPTPAPPGNTPSAYSITPGDTLSGISDTYHLGGWHHLYEQNQAIVGDNPDLIHPGQVLRLT